VRRIGSSLVLLTMITTWAVRQCVAGDPREVVPISTLEQLQAMGDDLEGSYILVNDIDASETATWNGGEGFVPIGSVDAPFTGQFDGRHHTIEGLHIHRPGVSLQGLFGEVGAFDSSAPQTVIMNVHLVNADITADRHSGTLIGRVKFSRVSGCSASGDVDISPDLSENAKSGGLAGHVSYGCYVDQCFSVVDVHAGARWQVGGLVGYLRGVEAVTRLSNSYSRGTVSGTGPKQGNLVGDADGSEVDRCYSSGLDKALIGYNFRDPLITNCYWDADRGAPASPYGGTPRTTAEMMLRGTYVDWDFGSIWRITDTQTYPWLQAWVPVELMRFTVE